MHSSPISARWCETRCACPFTPSTASRSIPDQPPFRRPHSSCSILTRCVSSNRKHRPSTYRVGSIPCTVPKRKLRTSGAEEALAVVDHHHWQLDGSAPELYQRYLVPAITTKWAEDLVDRALPRAGEAVLDIACGTGVVARLAARRMAEGL